MKVPKGMVCLLSALGTGKEKTKDGSTIYKFNQPIPMASNLLAVSFLKTLTKIVNFRSLWEH